MVSVRLIFHAALGFKDTRVYGVRSVDISWWVISAFSFTPKRPHPLFPKEQKMVFLPDRLYDCIARRSDGYQHILFSLHET